MPKRTSLIVFYSRLLNLIDRAQKRAIKFPNGNIVDRLLVLAAGDPDTTLANKAEKLIEKVRVTRQGGEDVSNLVVIEKLKQATEYREELFLAHRGRTASNPNNDKLLLANGGEKKSPHIPASQRLLHSRWWLPFPSCCLNSCQGSRGSCSW